MPRLCRNALTARPTANAQAVFARGRLHRRASDRRRKRQPAPHGDRTGPRQGRRGVDPRTRDTVRAANVKTQRRYPRTPAALSRRATGSSTSTATPNRGLGSLAASYAPCSPISTLCARANFAVAGNACGPSAGPSRVGVGNGRGPGAGPLDLAKSSCTHLTGPRGAGVPMTGARQVSGDACGLSRLLRASPAQDDYSRASDKRREGCERAHTQRAGGDCVWRMAPNTQACRPATFCPAWVEPARQGRA